MNTSEVPDVGNFSEVAANYSALAAVLAGFAFACLTTIALSPIARPGRISSAMKAAPPMTALFVSLVLISLNYAVIAGETDATRRLATVAVVSGVGFACAGILLPYVVLVLLGSVAADETHKKDQLSASVNFLKFCVGFAAPLLMLLEWSAVRDAGRMNGESFFGWSDWVCLIAAATLAINSLLAGLGIYARLWRIKRLWNLIELYPHEALRVLSYVAVTIVIASIVARVGALWQDPNEGWATIWLVFIALVYAVFAFVLTWSAMTYDDLGSQEVARGPVGNEPVATTHS